MADPIKIVVSGAAGRMGETACGAVEAAQDLELVGRADPELDTSVNDVLDGADVMVDFTTPDAAPRNAREAVGAGVHAVVGTSGFDLDALRDEVHGAEVVEEEEIEEETFLAMPPLDARRSIKTRLQRWLLAS